MRHLLRGYRAAGLIDSRYHRRLPNALTFATVLLVLSCGGGSGEKSPTTPTTPTPAATTRNPATAVPQGGALAGFVGTTLAVTVKVVDSLGVGVPAIVVNFVITAGSGSVFAPAVQTSESGQASQQWTLGRMPGANTLEVRWVSASGTGLVLCQLSATANAGPVSVLVSQAGALSALVGQVVSSTTIAVKALDQYQNPVENAGVAFAIDGTGGSISGATTAQTNSSGVASFAGVWTLGATPGTFSLVVTATDASATAPPLSISATAVQPFVASQVAVGANHRCALDAAGSAYCWGWNQYGQLGDGTNTNRSTPVAVQAGGQHYVALAAGGQHTCGLIANGTVQCWGRNEGVGALGDGTLTDRNSPVGVIMPSGVTYAKITAGAFHTCGLSAGGRAYCWGEAGMLGTSATAFVASTTPVQVTTDSLFATVDANGSRTTCGRTAGGRHLCWGNNQRGLPPFNTTPTLLFPSYPFSTLQPAYDFACALDGASVPWCWGWNANGQLGDGTQIDRTTPVRVVAAPALAELSLGANVGSYCGRANDGSVVCWGLGSGGLNAVRTIGGQLRFSQFKGGETGMCGITSTGYAMCSGSNNWGQLGNGGGSVAFETFAYVRSP